MTDVLYRYYVDPNEAKRVLTVARRKEGNTLKVAYAVCKALPDVRFRKPDVTYLEDHFSKRMGRVIATGRLDKGKCVTAEVGEYNANVTALMAILYDCQLRPEVMRTVQVALNKAMTQSQLDALAG